MNNKFHGIQNAAVGDHKAGLKYYYFSGVTIYNKNNNDEVAISSKELRQVTSSSQRFQRQL